MLKQTLQQKLLQKLSPQQIQFIKLLQVPTVSLDARVKEELEENPALEDGSLTNMNDPIEEYPDHDPEEKYSEEESNFDNDDFNVDEYIQEDDYQDYGNYGGNDDDEDRKEIPIAVQSSFYENLQNQLDLLALSDKNYLIGQQIIGSLDDDGYLRRPILSLIDDLAFSQNIMAEESEVLDMLKVIQEFEPAGIGARDLQECLLIQLRKKDQSNPIVEQAIQVVEYYLDEFTKKHYDKLEKTLNIDSAGLKAIVNEILKLNPKPGDSGAVAGKQLHVIPDFHITNNDGVLHLTLNSRNAPELKEAVQFVKQK